MESGLGSNLRARLSSALALNIESNQQEMTSELTVNFIMFFMNLKTKSTVHDIFQCNFKILNKTHNKKDIRTLEALHIVKTKPNSNSGVPVDLDVLSF